MSNPLISEDGAYRLDFQLVNEERGLFWAQVFELGLPVAGRSLNLEEIETLHAIFSDLLSSRTPGGCFRMFKKFHGHSFLLQFLNHDETKTLFEVCLPRYQQVIQ
jgi:hypothetical protein